MRIDKAVKNVEFFSPFIRRYIGEIVDSYLFSSDAESKEEALESICDDFGPLRWRAIEINQHRIYVHFANELPAENVEIKRAYIGHVPKSHQRNFSSYHYISFNKESMESPADNPEMELAE